MTQALWWPQAQSGPWGEFLYQSYVPDSGLQVDENGDPLVDANGNPLGIHNVNATGWSYEEMQNYIVSSWSTHFPENVKDVNDFSWEEIAQPENPTM